MAQNIKTKNQRIRFRFVSPDFMHIAPTEFVYNEGSTVSDMKH